MTLLRLIGRGFRDLFEQLMSLCALTLLWWLCLPLIFTSPPATIALFAMADPRRQVSTPEFRDAIEVFRSSFRRALGIAACTIPLLAILIWNIWAFAGTSHTLRTLIPLWMIMFVLLTILTLYAFSVAATMESGVRNAFRGAFYVLVSRPFMSIALSLFVLFLGLVMARTILPMILFGPALIATITNRMVLWTLDVHVPDPNAMTDERADEKERGVAPEGGVLSWIRGSSRQKRR